MLRASVSRYTEVMGELHIQNQCGMEKIVDYYVTTTTERAEVVERDIPSDMHITSKSGAHFLSNITLANKAASRQ